MTAMKKTTTKTKSPAPATSANKPTRKKAATPSTAKATPAAVPLTEAPAASPVPPALPVKASHAAPTIKSVAESRPAETARPNPVVRAVAPAKVQTRVIARIDVGFGNTLYIRGDGPGLSWNQGVPMECVASDQWEITLGESARPVLFKVLLNDQVWCAGPDNVLASGGTATITPEFA